MRLFPLLWAQMIIPSVGKVNDRVRAEDSNLIPQFQPLNFDKSSWPFESGKVEVPGPLAVQGGAQAVLKGMKGAVNQIEEATPEIVPPTTIAKSKASGLLSLGLVPAHNENFDQAEYQRLTQSPYMTFKFKKSEKLDDDDQLPSDLQFRNLLKEQIADVEKETEMLEKKRSRLRQIMKSVSRVGGLYPATVLDGNKSSGLTGFGTNTQLSMVAEKLKEKASPLSVADPFSKVTATNRIAANLADENPLPSLPYMGKRTLKTVTARELLGGSSSLPNLLDDSEDLSYAELSGVDPSGPVGKARKHAKKQLTPHFPELVI